MTTSVTCTKATYVQRSFENVEIFVLKMRRQVATAQMVAPIGEVADEEMKVDDDGEGAGTTCR